jgi:hypothetical protein
MSGKNLPSTSANKSVAAFLARANALAPAAGAKPAPKGRLIYAMDATASREPMWAQAAKIQGEMFLAARDLGGLAVQLVHYGGLASFEASPFADNAADLLSRMDRVRCQAGETQIANVLRHSLAETRAHKVGAVVFVGDAVEENADLLAGLAGQLALAGLPVFVFHEGGDPSARRTLETIARLTRGAYCPFDANAPDALKNLLAAAAAYAAGGRPALADLSKRGGGGATARTLLAQLGPPG